MDWPTLELAVKRVLESRFLGKTLSIVWHAGEPLVLPVDWYDEAFDRIESLNSGRTRITHHVQTNGVLINERWIELFHSRGVQVGLSLDGPERLHNAHRKTRSATGTHHRVMSAVELLNTSKLDYHVICVLTSAAMDAADEVYDFFSSCGVRMVGFNIEEIEGSNTSSSLARPGMVDAYRRFLARILELVKANGSLRIRELETARNLILSRGWEPLKNQQAIPLQIVSVGVNGNMSTFSPELMGNRNPAYGDFIFGNVKNHRLEELLTNDNFTAVHDEIQSGIVACRNRCAYFTTCGGGAPANKIFETGRFDVTETMFCRLACQAPIDVVLDDLETELGLNS